MAGRYKIPIDYEAVEKLANIQCTQEEIATFVGVSVRTFQRDEKCRELYDRGKENGKMTLRRYQFRLAEKNPSMAIFLGKQYLGQRDVIEETNNKEMTKLDELLSEIKNNANK